MQHGNRKFSLVIYRTLSEQGESGEWTKSKLGNSLEKNTFDPIYDVYHTSQKLQTIFNMKSCRITVSTNDLKPECFKPLFATILSGSYNRLVLAGECINSEHLLDLMDKARLNIELHISVFIRGDFRHDNAFKFQSFTYLHSHWARIEDLKSIRNSDEIRLKDTKFNCGDINSFLHYWVGCEEDMLNYLIVELEKNEKVDEQIILKDIKTYNATHDKKCGTFMINAADRKQRLLLVGKLTIYEGKNMVSLQTYHATAEGRNNFLQ
ncbi:hypothetical protein CRE_01552 [Caenorhabditis remanei]|uniref:Uncharacterized protein n=1 Tax=Caenorhabditis remanei TaxID=31234 RepID=E3LGE8_CAERE|nr:hypothetical protein CRE_01552 [Caenorhabditis remanei]